MTTLRRASVVLAFLALTLSAGGVLAQGSSASFSARVDPGLTYHDFYCTLEGSRTLVDVNLRITVTFKSGKEVTGTHYAPVWKPSMERKVTWFGNRGQIQKAVVTGTADIDGRTRAISQTFLKVD